MSTLDLSLSIEGMPAAFGVTLNDFIVRFGKQVLNGHTRAVNKAAKQNAPSRTPSERKFKRSGLKKVYSEKSRVGWNTGGQLYPQTSKYGTLKKNLSVKVAPKRALRRLDGDYFAAYSIMRNDAYWYNFLTYHKSMTRTTKKGHNRGTLNPPGDFVRYAIERSERSFLAQIHEAHRKALEFTYKYYPNPPVAKFSSTGTSKPLPNIKAVRHG